jgi:hypothetical protein
VGSGRNQPVGSISEKVAETDGVSDGVAMLYAGVTIRRKQMFEDVELLETMSTRPHIYPLTCSAADEAGISNDPAGQR